MEDFKNFVAFPHILNYPSKRGGQFRFVQPEKAVVGDLVLEKERTQFNPDTNKMESVYKTFSVDSITECRKARGVWSAWPSHPFYHDTEGKFVGEQFESDLATTKFIIPKSEQPA